MKFPRYAYTSQGDKSFKASSMKKDAKEGYYKLVPGFKPPTRIFIKHGQDPDKVIEEFKNRRMPK